MPEYTDNLILSDSFCAVSPALSPPLSLVHVHKGIGCPLIPSWCIVTPTPLAPSPAFKNLEGPFHWNRATCTEVTLKVGLGGDGVGAVLMTVGAYRLCDVVCKGKSGESGGSGDEAQHGTRLMSQISGVIDL